MSLCLPCRDLPRRLGLLLHGRGRGSRHAVVHLAGLLLGQEAETIPLLSLRARALPASPGSHGQPPQTRNFQVLSLRSGMAPGRQGGERWRKVTQPGWAVPGSLTRACSTKIQARKTALANGENLHAPISGQAGGGWQRLRAGVAPGSPSVRRSRKHTRTHRC